MADLTGQTLGQYRIESRLGEGGTSVIYRAYQPSMQRFVAIKVLKTDASKDRQFIERFMREGRLVAQLQHPHILPVIEFGQTGEFAYLVMVLLEGGSLRHYLHENAPLSLRECGRLFIQIASALEHAHGRGVIHRDLKPANVLLDESDNAYLTDFGIARIMQQEKRLTATGVLMGTPHYISPEQAMGKPADVRSDIYALGVMLYEIVTGKVPFDAETAYGLIFQHIQESPPNLRSINPDIPAAVEAVVLKALEKDPRDRYQTPMSMAEALAEALPKTRKHTQRDEKRAEQQPLGMQEASDIPHPATPTPTLVPTRTQEENKIRITNIANDPRMDYPCTNGYMHSALRALEEIAGKQATEIILRFAGLEDALDHYPPNDVSLSDRYTFKHYSDLNHAVLNYYGAAGREAIIHLGRVSARWIVQQQPAFGFASTALRLMPTAAAMRLSLNQYANALRKLYVDAGYDMEIEIREKPGFFLLATPQCPCCVGKKSNAPICWLFETLLAESATLIKGKTFHTQQLAGRSMGHPYCVWRLNKRPVD